MPGLITLAKIVAVIHILIYAIVAGALIIIPGLDSYSVVGLSVLVYASLLVMFTVLSKIFFRDDCALRIFEYCLRGLGGQEIDHSRLNSMSTPKAMLMERDELYRRLFWQSGLFLLVAAAVCIGGVVAAAMWEKTL